MADLIADATLDTAPLTLGDPLPCPFCGMPPFVRQLGPAVLIRCDNAGCGPAPSVSGRGAENVVQAWNARAPVGG